MVTSAEIGVDFVHTEEDIGRERICVVIRYHPIEHDCNVQQYTTKNERRKSYYNHFITLKTNTLYGLDI